MPMRYRLPTRVWKTFFSFVRDFIPPRPAGGFWNVVGLTLVWLLVLNPVFWLMVFVLRGVAMAIEWVRDRQPAPSPLLSEPYVTQPSWLLSRVTVEEAEQAESDHPDHPWIDGVPFGYTYRHWCAVKAVMQTGDELWKFCSPPDSWENLHGTAGYVLIREGRVIAQIITVEN